MGTKGFKTSNRLALIFINAEELLIEVEFWSWASRIYSSTQSALMLIHVASSCVGILCMLFVVLFYDD